MHSYNPYATLRADKAPAQSQTLQYKWWGSKQQVLFQVKDTYKSAEI